MDSEVPPHFHFLDPIPEENIIPNGSFVSVVPDWPAREGTKVLYLDSDVFRVYIMLDGVWREIGSAGSGPAGDDWEVQFNHDDAFESSDRFFYENEPGGQARMYAQDGGGDGQYGGDSRVLAGDGYDNGATGGAAHLVAGNGHSATPGDHVTGGDAIVAAGGATADYGDGGNGSLGAGNGGGIGNGGNTDIFAGNSGNTAGFGGNVNANPGRARGSDYKSGDLILASQLGADGAKQGRVLIEDDRDNPLGVSYRFVGEALTTSASSQTYTIAGVPEDSSLFVEAKIVANRTGGSAGSAGDSAAYVIRAAYKRVGSGAPSLVGSIQSDFTVEDQAGWDATLSIVSNDILLQVTGAPDNNITWHFEILYLTSETGII